MIACMRWGRYVNSEARSTPCTRCPRRVGHRPIGRQDLRSLVRRNRRLLSGHGFLLPIYALHAGRGGSRSLARRRPLQRDVGDRERGDHDVDFRSEHRRN